MWTLDSPILSATADDDDGHLHAKPQQDRSVLRLAESPKYGRKHPPSDRIIRWAVLASWTVGQSRVPRPSTSGSRPYFRVPPRCAPASEPADDETAGRMVREPDCLYRRGAVVLHAVQFHVLRGRVIRVDEDVAGAEVGRPRVTDAAIVDHPDAANVSLERPVRMADAHEVRVAFSQYSCEQFVRMPRMKPGPIVEPGCHMRQENASSVRQACAFFDRQRREPIAPAGGRECALGPGEGVRDLHQSCQELRLGARVLYRVRSLAGEKITFSVSLDERCIGQGRESLQGADRTRTNGDKVTEHPVRICASASGDVREDRVEGDAVAVDI